MPSTLTNNTQAACALAFSQSALFCAWGTGSAGWDVSIPSPPLPLDTADALTAEVGRVKVGLVEFLVQDSAGILTINSVRYNISLTPTNIVHFRAVFLEADFSSGSIREHGFFIGTVVDPTLPIGQPYFTPDQVTNLGVMLSLEHYAPIIRNSATREVFDLVLTF